MRNNFINFKVDIKKTVLSSQTVIYKTENFIKQTRYITNVDFFISKLCEGIILNFTELLQGEKNLLKDDVNCFRIQTADKQLSFLFKLGFQIDSQLNKMDIVFFEYLADHKEIRQNDQRLNDYLKTHSIIDVTITKDKRLSKKQDFNKLYIVSNNSGINLPKLSQQQKEIVETVDQNVLVQGVAGSGKTNVCIDKIIFSACKNYGGRVLYTTFSRGLLIDTKLKVEEYKKGLEIFVEDLKNNNVIFVDNNHKKALENKFGVYFFSDDNQQIINKIQNITEFLSNKVDYYLIEDIFKNKFGEDVMFVDEKYFINTYANKLTNHQLAKNFKKLEKYSSEVIFKEIFGMILGFYDINNPKDIMPLQTYVSLRENSFSKQECETIYQIAIDFKKYCENQKLLDNNSASKILLKNIDNYSPYSLAIIDEVQDYTQVNLCLFKKLSLKLFCVGDALQMINPSYFSFGYLKNLLFEKNLTSVKELQHNYRNTKKIEEIIDNLSEINKTEFGTHKFVIKGECVDSGIKSVAVYVKASDFAKQVANSKLDNFTFVVANTQQKKRLQNILKNQEVLTVSEIKGLERNTIVAYNLLSDNADKWKLLELSKINHKQADENSVFRYYYNLFYVGVSRAKQNIFIVENQHIKQFENFFKENFEIKNVNESVKKLTDIVSKIEFTETEVLERVNEFIKLAQYDNARFTANKITDDLKRIQQLNRIEVTEKYIHHGKYREAGIKFWEYGMIDYAKKQFKLSGDTKLIELIDACSKNNDSGLNIDIVNYFVDVMGNKLAQSFIIETLQKDVNNLKNSFKEIKQTLKKVGSRNGK